MKDKIKGIPLYLREPKVLARNLIDTNIKMHEYKIRIDKALGDKEIKEIPQFKGTLEQLDNLTILGGKE